MTAGATGGGSGGTDRPARAVVFAPRALKELAALPKADQRRMTAALDRLAETGRGDVRKLTDVEPAVYRLRSGSYRAFVTLSPELIAVERIVNRRDAYR